jgi:hypothetical protein
MLALPLAALLSTLPPALDTWAQRACPPAKQTPGSNVERKRMEQERAQCLRKAMERSLDKTLPALKRSRPEAEALQEDHARWVAEACATVEEASWVDPATGERSMGTGYGFTESECLQRQYAWRGFFADAWSRSQWRALRPVLEGEEERARRVRESLMAYQERARETAARAREQAQVGVPRRTLSREDWRSYLERLERALSGAESLARRQCELTPEASEDCARRLAECLAALMGFPDMPAASRPRP